VTRKIIAEQAKQVISRELVQRTLEFDSPARIPRQIWLLPWATDHFPDEVARIRQRFPDDIISSPPFYREEPPHTGDPYLPGQYTDEWGCTFTNVQKGIIGIVKNPPLSRWDQLDALRIPQELLSVNVNEVNAFCRQTDRFVLAACCPRPFERLQFLRGTENLFIDLARPPAELAELIDSMHAFYIRELELWAQTEVDALTIMDDWGSQDAMLISPAMWREMFKPLYKEYINIARQSGKYIFMHSDGYILDILPDLIEMGLDAINAQVACMGIQILGQQFAGMITFWGELDRQHLLPEGTKQEVIDTVHEMTQALHRNGGLIAQCEFGINARPENVYAAFEAWDSAES
jgi:hypothetical protein